MSRDSHAAAEAAKLLLDRFLADTGVTGTAPPRRYLWTDAFAVCTLLGLDERGLRPDSGSRDYGALALELVDQVHHVLGRHREDDLREGWLSGLPEAEGDAHPTAGGLRIGKPLPERPAGVLPDPRTEWDRDGQYFHYLTRWMHALLRVAEARGNEPWLRWAVELARAAHRGFVRSAPHDGHRTMAWKMSIGLDRPQVDTSGHHDPLDGYLTLLTLTERARQTGFRSIALGREIAELRDLAGIAGGRGWATEDPLGLGGLLAHAWEVVQLHERGVGGQDRLFLLLLDSAVAGYRAFRSSPLLSSPPAFRLPFRELGLALGAHAVERILDAAHADRVPGGRDPALRRLHHLDGLRGLARRIEDTWLDPEHRRLECWTDHGDINAVMLAASLLPESYLRA